MVPGTLWFLVVGSVLAAEPPPITPAQGTDGVWRTEIVIPASVEAIRAALGDPIQAARFSPDITKIQYVTRETCPTLHVETGGSFMPVNYDYRRCATKSGWHETLLSSNMLSTYEVRWTFESVEAGTKVSYDVHIKPTFPAPDFLFARAMRESITTLVGRLYRNVTGG
ncbi:MAG: SRPBCC family protein [Pseudomonadota bacterium]|nr:SRPBCC family protein [Pseudomonadota bacterium]